MGEVVERLLGPEGVRDGIAPGRDRRDRAPGSGVKGDAP